MAIKLENKVNTEAPSVAYPFGNIKDNTGSNNGTPVDKNVYADFHQFFAKMMSESGIAYNDLPDNNTDGFQYWLALVEAVKNNCGDYIDITGSVTVNTVKFSVISLKVLKYFDNTILVTGILSHASTVTTSTAILSDLPATSSNLYQGVIIMDDLSGTIQYKNALLATGISIGNLVIGEALSTAGTNIAFTFTYKIL